MNIFKQRNMHAMVAEYQSQHSQGGGSGSAGRPQEVIRKEGLILFVGATGSGKSTSLAA